MSQNQSLNLRMTVYTALFTALIIIGGYISFPIPLSPIPIVLSDFFVMLAGLILGASWGTAGVGLFFFIGLLGLPVFAGGKAGLAVLFGPTGGYLIGFLVSAYLIGLISRKGKPKIFKDLFALIVGHVIIYAFGVSWLAIGLHLTWEKALVAGVIPFIPGMIIKTIVLITLVRILRPLLKHSISNLTKIEE